MRLGNNVTGRRLCQAVAMIFGTAFAVTATADGVLKLSAGYDYSSGDYGQTVTTEISTLPVTINYLSDNWSFKLTVPYLSITGNGTVVPGPGGPSTFDDFGSGFFGNGPGSSGAASTTQTVTTSGFGDITASIGYALFPASGDFHEFTAKVKFATADETQGLGTGENDYYLQYDAVLNTGRLMPFYTLGYVITGDSIGVTYNDVAYGSLGVMWSSTRSSTLGVVYDYRQATIDGSDDLQQATLFVSLKSGNKWSTTLSASSGFTDSSPDSGFNITLTRQY